MTATRMTLCGIVASKLARNGKLAIALTRQPDALAIDWRIAVRWATNLFSRWAILTSGGLIRTFCAQLARWWVGSTLIDSGAPLHTYRSDRK